MTVTLVPAGSWGIVTCTNPSTEKAAILALPGSWPIGLQPQCFVRNDQWAAALTPPGLPVAGAVLWYDASAITGVADGATLNAWPDGTTNHRDLARAAGAPLYYKTTSAKLVNGKPAVWFNGADCLSAGSVATLAQPFTVMLVAGSTGASGLAMPLSASGPVQTAIDTTNKYYLKAGGSWMQSTTVAPAGANFVAFTFNDASSSIQTNATVWPVTSSPGTNSFGGTVVVGANFNAADSFFFGPICELAVWPGALTGGQLASLRSYAQSKWGTP